MPFVLWGASGCASGVKVNFAVRSTDWGFGCNPVGKHPKRLRTNNPVQVDDMGHGFLRDRG
jgi:hypothetical protein